MRSIAMLFVVVVAVVGGAAVPGAGAPAPAVWNGDPQVVSENREAWTAFGAVTTYKSRMSGISAQGPFEMTMEWVKPNRLRMSFTNPQPGAFIFIEGVRWATSARGCNRVPGNIQMPGSDVVMPDRPLEGTITVTRAGTQTIDGVVTNVYDTVIVDSRGQTKMKTYVTPSTKLFKRWEVESAQGKVNIDYLEFNTGITIDPPC